MLTINLKLVLISIFSLVAFTTVFAQTEKDSVILLNGRVYRGEIISFDDHVVKLNEKDKKGEVFQTQIENYRVFSFTKNNTETIVYKYNEQAANFLTVDEAKNATLGSYDARKTFKPRVVFWSSLALGYGASLYDTYLQKKSIDNKDYVGDFTSPGFFKSRPSFFPVLVPIVLTAVWAIPSFKLKEKKMIQLHLKNNDSYYRGYHRVAKQKRMLAALRGSLIGIGAGMLTYAVFKP